ncbi:GbsR/MarR family transcriptional regulator [Cupriavidus sp. TMH.W2]|uniref:GbsR/MarR family transcriptional regulator n=1 Tax=Cupriavidus sp. TMH.W2 TaxID=3434465 RepID=UPI003D7751AD
MHLSPLAQLLIAHLGDLGSQCGLSRTASQILSLLYIAPRALNADEIAQALSRSRSNISVGLRELDSWNLTRPSQADVPRDRREYLRVPADVWVSFRTLAAERKRREIDPALRALRALRQEADVSQDDPQLLARIDALVELLALLGNWLHGMQRLDDETLRRTLRHGAAQEPY